MLKRAAAVVSEPPKPPPVRSTFNRIAGAVLIVATALLLLQLVIDPLGLKQFLVDRRFQATVERAAQLAAVSMGLMVCALLLWAYLRPSVGSSVDDRSWPGGAGSFIGTLVLFGFYGAYIGNQFVVVLLPALLHRLSDPVETKLPFVINDTVSRKQCHGVRAKNPEIYHDELCGVQFPEGIAVLRGRTVMVWGTRSSYGFAIDRFALLPST